MLLQDVIFLNENDSITELHQEDLKLLIWETDITNVENLLHTGLISPPLLYSEDERRWYIPSYLYLYSKCVTVNRKKPLKWMN